MKSRIYVTQNCLIDKAHVFPLIICLNKNIFKKIKFYFEIIEPFGQHEFSELSKLGIELYVFFL